MKSSFRQPLTNPTETPLDRELSRTVTALVLAGPFRHLVTEKFSRERCGALMEFALRQAVFAMRERSRRRLRLAAAAVAMIHPSCVDPRDTWMLLPRLHYAARKIGVSSDRLLGRTARMSAPLLRPIIESFIHQPEEEKSPEKAGFADIGTGFIEHLGSPYAPRHDLVRMALAIAALLPEERFDTWTGMARNPPADHFDGDVQRELRDVRGGTVVNAWPPGDMQHHRVWAFIAETATPADAAALRTAAMRKKSDAPRLALAGGELFVLLAADDEPLEPFAAPIEALLAR